MHKKPDLNMMRYWRNSLADAARVVIEVEKQIYQYNAVVNWDQGRVEELQALFLINAANKKLKETKPDSPELQEVSILLSLFRVSAAPESAKRSGESGIFYPFWIRAVLDRAGRLKPDEDTFPYIPRAYLEPQVNQDLNFTFADVDIIDQAFGKPFNKEVGWNAYFTYIQGRFAAITGQELATYTLRDFVITWENTLVVQDSISAAADGIIGLYDYMIQRNEVPVTLRNLAHKDEQSIKNLLSTEDFERASAAHLGQMAFEFPLSQSQRTSLYHYTTLGHGDTLAINGPPGTGKTTLLQSIVATEVVSSAIAGNGPAVILACSANNQAVTNIIESFSSLKQKDGQLYSRWLPDLGGFGLYLPGANREVPRHIPVLKRVSGKLNGQHTEKENETYLNKAEAYFISKSGYANLTTAAIVKKLRNTLKGQQKLLSDVVASWQSYQKLIAQLPELQSFSLKEIEESMKQLELKFSDYIDSESIFIKLFAFLMFVKEKRATRFKQLFRDCAIAYDQIDFYKITSLTSFFDEKLELIKQIRKAENEWQTWQKKIKLYTDPSHPIFYEQLEMGLKYDMFYTAVHYWEGRWLLATRAAVDEERLSKNGINNATDRWQRFAMLTPCFVSTFYMAPRFFSYSKYIGTEAGKNIYEAPPLLDFVNLLIVDEAGQVSPEIGAATFALAQKALVVGDILQIEPVWNVPKKVDQANLFRYGVIKDPGNHEGIEDLYTKGFLSSSGSIMRLAQKASYYHLQPKQARGMLLTEHRRCFDEIISYCNNLAYDALLQPMKGPARGGLYHPFNIFQQLDNHISAGAAVPTPKKHGPSLNGYWQINNP